MPNAKMFTCRLSAEALINLETLVELLRQRTPGSRVSQSSAVSFALGRAVAELEEDARSKEEEQEEAARKADVAKAFDAFAEIALRENERREKDRPPPKVYQIVRR